MENTTNLGLQQTRFVDQKAENGRDAPRRGFKAEPASGCDRPRKDRGDRIVSRTGAQAEGRLHGDRRSARCARCREARSARTFVWRRHQPRVRLQRADLIVPTEHLGRVRGYSPGHDLIERKTKCQHRAHRLYQAERPGRQRDGSHRPRVDRVLPPARAPACCSRGYPPPTLSARFWRRWPLSPIDTRNGCRVQRRPSGRDRAPPVIFCVAIDEAAGMARERMRHTSPLPQQRNHRA